MASTTSCHPFLFHHQAALPSVFEIINTGILSSLALFYTLYTVFQTHGKGVSSLAPALSN